LARAQAIGPDILHSHFGPLGWGNIEVVRRLGLKHVVSFYGFDVNYLPQSSKRWYQRYADLFQHVDLVLCEGPYMAASVPAGRRAPEDLFAPRHLGVVGKIIEQVLAAEAPIHLEVLARRVGAYFGIGRLTQRVTDQVRVALAGRGRWGDEDDIVWRLDQDPSGVPGVRVAGQGASARREIHEVPLAEVAAAARIVVERAVGIAAADLVRDAARLLGFARITDRVIERIAAGVRIAAQRNLIVVAAGRASLPD